MLNLKGDYENCYLSTKFILLSKGKDVFIFNLKTKKIDEKFENIHSVTKLSVTSKYIITGGKEGDVKLFSIPKQYI